MGKSLLLGNGINAHLGIKDLEVDKIYNRFLNLIDLEKTVYESVFGQYFDYEKIRQELLAVPNKGIESLAGTMYSCIKSSTVGKRWTDNDEERLQDIIACSAINAIFFGQEGKIGNGLSKENGLNTSAYDSVFTLNYYEFWDAERICTHLHGFFDLDGYKKSTQFLISNRRKYLDSYSSAVGVIEGDKGEIDYLKTVFAPQGLKKDQLVCIRGLFPSDNLFLADDLFLFAGNQELYKELKNIKEIDVFGMSPYGDDALIDHLNNMSFVRVFVYNMQTSEETNVWEQILKTKHEILDSSFIKL